jgi:tRNA(adenine34) deaminase
MVASAAMYNALPETAVRRATALTGGDDEFFMHQAIATAILGAEGGEVPVGAVLVRHNTVLARAHNAPIGRNDPTAHAEILVIRNAAQAEGNYRLVGTTLYVTVEPCLMCVGALLHARVERVVFGCREPKGGALGSVYDICGDGRVHAHLQVTGGLLADESRELLQIFFRARRGA